MYIVSCSACGQAEKSPFARVGAVMVCTSCKAKVPLRAEDVKRQYKVRTDIDDELFRVPQIEREEAAAPPLDLQPAAAAAAPALHDDHADLAAEAERRAEANRRRKVRGQPSSRAAAPSAEAAGQLAKKKQMQFLGIFAGVGTLVLVVLIAVLASGGKTPTTDGTKDAGIKDTAIKDGSTDGTKKDSTAKDGSIVIVPPVKDGEKDGSIAKDGTPRPPVTDGGKPVPPPVTVVRVAAMPLGIDAWQTVSEAYHASPPEGGVMLVDEASEKQDSGEQIFKAKIVCQEGVASALVSVTLVNDEDRVYAKFERPFYLLEGRKPRPMTLVIPKNLVGSTTCVYWAVQAIDTHVKNAQLLEDALAEVLKADATPVLKLAAYNPGDRALRDAAFVIQALDAGGQITSQWRLKYPGEVAAKSWVKFEVELPPTDVKSVASWRVLGAGIPSGEAVLPPPPVVPEERDPKAPIRPRGRGLFDF